MELELHRRGREAREPGPSGPSRGPSSHSSAKTPQNAFRPVVPSTLAPSEARSSEAASEATADTTGSAASAWPRAEPTEEQSGRPACYPLRGDKRRAPSRAGQSSKSARAPGGKASGTDRQSACLSVSGTLS